MPLDPARTVAELKELRELTGDEDGAQRVAWTDTWVRAQEWMAGEARGHRRRDGVRRGAEPVVDAARPLGAGAADRRAPRLGPERRLARRLAERRRRRPRCSRRIAEEGEPPVTVRLVSWADEEGARFGRSLFGSSRGGRLDGRPGRAAAAGRPRRRRAARRGRRARRRPRPRDSTRARSSRTRLRTSSSTSSRGRCSSRWACPSARCWGRSASSGIASSGAARPRTPARRRWISVATRWRARRSSRWRSASIAAAVGGGAVCTSGDVVCKPGIVTSVVETAEQLLDQRHLDASKLASMLARREVALRPSSPREEDIEVEFERIWNIEPILFDEELIGFADEAIREVAGESHRLPSGPLHDAAEVSRAGHPDRDALRPEPARALAHEARGHEGGAPRAVGAGPRPARLEDDRAARLEPRGLVAQVGAGRSVDRPRRAVRDRATDCVRRPQSAATSTAVTGMINCGVMKRATSATLFVTVGSRE